MCVVSHLKFAVFFIKKFRRKFDPLGTGTIATSRLVEALVNRGDKLSPQLVRKYIEDPTYGSSRAGDDDDDDATHFDYVAFLKETLKTSDKLLSHVKAVTAENETNYAINSKTYTKVYCLYTLAPCGR